MPKPKRRKPEDVPALPDDMAQMLRELNLDSKTKRAYFWGLQDLAAYLDAHPITEGTLIEYAADLRDRRKDKARTVAAYVVAARRYLRWRSLRNTLPLGVSYDRMALRLEDAGTRRQGYKQRPTDKNILRLLDYFAQDIPDRGAARLVALRNRALMAFLYDTGCRIGEALALSRAEVQDGRAERVRLTETKNGKPRTVFLGDGAQAAIQAYTAARADSARAPLFVSHGRGTGAALTAGRVWQIIHKAADHLELLSTTSAHSLRHARAQDLLNDGMALQWVSALLGHARVDTTREVYAFETDEDMLRDEVRTHSKK